eukprot:TRINITY_DN72168_c0_g1_i1.p1 TRINITY_DN72168_c0_g1~~TRINITY_DN72168_c0_g1_i1.p1  ORF type:complete len:243 (+),score=45.50 TRINITY_DN72168_c0_g1_i1:56-730(+)
MVIPIGGMGVPLMGPPPASVAPKFKIIKYCILGMMACIVGQLLCGVLLGQIVQSLLNSLNLILNTVIGIWLLKDDPTIARVYDFLARTCCGPCAEQCQGGMNCLMSFIICNVITVVLSVLLDGSIQYVIHSFSIMLNAVDFYDAFILWLLLASTAGALVAQIVGSVYAWLAYKEVRDSGVTMSGGDWASGGTAYPQARDVEPARPARPAANFTPFQGGGNRLGS